MSVSADRSSCATFAQPHSPRYAALWNTAVIPGEIAAMRYQGDKFMGRLAVWLKGGGTLEWEAHTVEDVATLISFRDRVLRDC
jgi:hypothetical protein